MIFYRALKPFKAVSFDLDDTLYENHAVIAAAEQWFAAYLCDTYHLPGWAREVSFWARRRAELGERESGLKNDVTLHRIMSLLETFAALGRPLAGGMEEASALVDIFIARRSSDYVPPQNIALLRHIGSLMPAAAISNGNVDLKRIGLDGIFRWDLRPGVRRDRRKPFPDLFEHYARLLRVRPDEILHIGDEPKTDLLGPLNAGCQCAWLYRGHAGLSPDERELRQLPTLRIDTLAEIVPLIEHMAAALRV